MNDKSRRLRSIGSLSRAYIELFLLFFVFFFLLVAFFFFFLPAKWDVAVDNGVDAAATAGKPSDMAMHSVNNTVRSFFIFGCNLR
ncbi:MAG TPA: hypothetical protein VKV79_05750 [Terriglobia bacterium]|nr:hypothetical protein [Terriglobia bacterium]